MHDPVYKLLFSEPRMVEDLLRAFVPDVRTDALDFSTLDKQPTEYVGENLRRRLGDMLWRVRFHAPAHHRGARELLVMLEFQSSSDPDMAIRILAYAGLAHQQSVHAGALNAHGALLPVLLIVLYNGESRWTVAAEAGELVAAVDSATGSSSAMRPIPCSSEWSGCDAAARTAGHRTNTKCNRRFAACHDG